MNSARGRSPLAVFTQPKMAALLLLGFSSGLPLYLTGTGRAFQAWMTGEGVDLTTIGLFSLVALPYSLKFLWAPLLDRWVPPFLGRRRGWIVLMQLALLLVIPWMALQDPGEATRLLVSIAFLVALFGATQDVAIDAYRTDVLDEHEMGAGAALWVVGYRVALLVVGGLAFVFADLLSWPIVYFLMAALLIPSMIGTWRAPEPLLHDQPPRTLAEAVKLPFLDFFTRAGTVRAAAVLLFIVLYKLSDYLAQAMATPFLLQVGFSQTEIGAIQGGIGLGATIVGALAGGAVVARVGINRSIWVFGILQALSNLMYYLLSLIGPSSAFLVATMVVENFCTGLVTAGFVAFLMSMCSVRFSATQFALLSSLMAASRDLLVAPAGAIAEATGWPSYFLVTLAAGLPGLLLLPVFAPWSRESPLIAARHTGETVSAEDATRAARRAGKEDA